MLAKKISLSYLFAKYFFYTHVKLFLYKNMNKPKRDLFNLENLSLEQIKNILNTAQDFCDHKINLNLKNKIACNLFFEPSTRTAYSFQVAQEKLGMKVIFFNPESSSLKKNESFYDTIKTFDSFDLDLLIIRDAREKYYQELINKIKTPIINAGDGSGSHPTQSLLDLLTIRQEFNMLKNISVMISGDIIHSRVAHTNFKIMQRLGMQVYTSGPSEYLESELNPIEFNTGLKICDVIMMLRVQLERHNKKYNLENYNKFYGLNSQNINLIKPNAIIMHPAPVNRNIELTDDIIESPRSRIFKQISNGVFTRMAVIKYILDI